MIQPAASVLDRAWTDVTWAVVDVEGNGQPQPDLVEIAIVPIRGGDVGPARSWLVRPPRPVTWRARQVHGLSDEDLQHAPTIEQLAVEILAELADVDVVAGHQVSVDLSVVRRVIVGWPDLPAADTLRLARGLFPELSSHRLGALAEHLGLADALPGSAHRAAFDATVAARLLVHLATAMTTPTVGDLLNVGPARANRAPGREDAAPTLFEVP